MRQISFAAALALSAGCVGMSMAAMPSVALAQAAPAPQQPAAQPPMKQMVLTEKQVMEVPPTQKEMDAITDKLPEVNPDKPDPKVLAQLEAVAKKHGFAGYAEYNDVVDNISLVLDGIDPQTKKYIGSDALLKQQIAAIQADNKMPAKDKKEALDELNQALKTPAAAVQNKGNIELVVRHYDKLIVVLQENEE